MQCTDKIDRSTLRKRKDEYNLLKKVSYIQYLLDLVEQGAVFKKLKKQEGLCLESHSDQNDFDSYKRILTLRRDDQLRVDSVKEFIKNHLSEVKFTYFYNIYNYN